MSDDAPDSIASILSRLIREKDETRHLIAAFGRGEISSEYVVKELVSRYQREVLGAMHGLAAFDEDAAKRLGDSLKQGIEGVVAQIGTTGGGGKDQPKLAASEAPPPRQQGVGTLADRDNPVLCREYALVWLLNTRPNQIVKTGELIAAARKLERHITDEAVTAQLGRLATSQIIERARKGYYRSTPQSLPHLQALASEIEARGLALPSVA